ncbi:hypothetical protein [uncultured Shewanella sp.]|uniref:hypothetical protein n=1 Tax=uncultured Shewanella sp. TaxID=173975 RepID=UPI00263420BF|nr:hypothetical protein [uncultured Shewanella sp.]
MDGFTASRELLAHKPAVAINTNEVMVNGKLTHYTENVINFRLKDYQCESKLTITH